MKLFNKLYFWLYEWHERDYRKIDNEYYGVELTPALVAERFKLLYKLHGVEVTEIPELESEEITLSDLSSNERLLEKLTPGFLHKTAEKFGVRIEWLRSGEAEMYHHCHWYQSRTKSFFVSLKEINFKETYDPFVILTTHDKFDVHSKEYQPFILVLRNHFAVLGEKDVYKYSFEFVRDWHHSTCRLGAKAIATRYYQLTGRMITICKTSKETFYKIKEGYIPPDLAEGNYSISFEEYGALKFPHLDEPYEAFEYEKVLKTIKEFELDKIDGQFDSYEGGAIDKRFADKGAAIDEKSSEAGSLQEKAAYARYEPVYRLKRQCVNYWIETEKKFGFRETARRFSNTLPDDNKILTKTGRVDTLAEALSEYDKRDSLESKGELPKWLEGFNPED